MLDVTDKGIINQVVAYSNSTNAKQFLFRLLFQQESILRKKNYPV